MPYKIDSTGQKEIGIGGLLPSEAMLLHVGLRYHQLGTYFCGLRTLSTSIAYIFDWRSRSSPNKARSSAVSAPGQWDVTLITDDQSWVWVTVRLLKTETNTKQRTHLPQTQQWQSCVSPHNGKEETPQTVLCFWTNILRQCSASLVFFFSLWLHFAPKSVDKELDKISVLS